MESSSFTPRIRHLHSSSRPGGYFRSPTMRLRRGETVSPLTLCYKPCSSALALGLGPGHALRSSRFALLTGGSVDMLSPSARSELRP
jgi:hypothetical protein